ncbi:SprB repeat-containing protein [Fulvivirgaceae bacterium BMA10]|uniref:SprB repeat-containing protein n=1 Tax=Splendidivirga corallicola TaxID=3051826 RepID=A0ABT8KSN2_9BACT|nr:SprB repeat-containing protein [Fulvivirgaceae bacterium BMA10]
MDSSRGEHLLRQFGLLFTIGILPLGLLLIQSCGDDTEVDCSVSGPSISLAGTTQSTCGVDNGTIQVNGSGGAGELTYSLDGGNFQSSQAFQNVAGGDHTITVKDGNNCMVAIDVTVEEVTDIVFTGNTTNAGCGGDSGTLTISASGGAGNYQYKLDDGSFQSSNAFSNVSNGNRTVTVKDANDCEQTSEVYVPSGISYNAAVKSIIETSCAVSGCHVASVSERVNFEIFANIQSNAADIKSRTQSGNMPRGGSISEEAKEAIACWVDDGAKDN